MSFTSVSIRIRTRSVLTGYVTCETTLHQKTIIRVFVFTRSTRPRCTIVVGGEPVKITKKKKKRAHGPLKMSVFRFSLVASAFYAFFFLSILLYFLFILFFFFRRPFKGPFYHAIKVFVNVRFAHLLFAYPYHITRAQEQISLVIGRFFCRGAPSKHPFVRLLTAVENCFIVSES